MLYIVSQGLSLSEDELSNHLGCARPIPRQPRLSVTVMVAGTASSEVHSVAAVVIAAATSSQYAMSTANTSGMPITGISSHTTGESGTEINKAE